MDFVRGQSRHLSFLDAATFLDRLGPSAAGFQCWMGYDGLLMSPEISASAAWLLRASDLNLTSGLRQAEKPETALMLRCCRWIAGNSRIGVGVGLRRHSSLVYPLPSSLSSSYSIVGGIPLSTVRRDRRAPTGGASSSAAEERCAFFLRPRIRAENQEPGAEALGAPKPGSASSDL